VSTGQPLPAGGPLVSSLLASPAGTCGQKEKKNKASSPTPNYYQGALHYYFV